MEIFHQDSVRHETRGTEIRDYYDSAQFRIVVTHIPPGHTQNEHRHSELYDITWVLEGEVEISERDDNGVTTAVVAMGGLAVCAPGPFHNITNLTTAPATLLTLKFVPRPGMTADEFAELNRVDWHPFDPTRR